MTQPVTLALWAAATILLAGGTSLVVLRWGHPHDEPHHDFHQWVHKHLSLTAEQYDQLQPAEQRFAERQAALHGEIAEAGRALAAAIESGERDSAEIDLALERLHTAQADLQRATLDHFFEMKEQLDPEQAEKLLRWTHDRLLHP